MSRLFEELDYCPTEIGVLTLRRRREMRLGRDIFEIKLGDAHLMSDLFTVSEAALADLGLGAARGGDLRVVVGGLGMGYTALAALKDARVSELLVVEFLAPVIEWHRRGILPVGDVLAADDRVRLVQGDFFALSAGGAGFDPDRPGAKFDAVLLDIDHSPEMLLDARSRSFYEPDGLRALAAHLRPGGVFGLWSNERPSDAFTQVLCGVFAHAWANKVVFENPYDQSEIVQTVYLARTGAAAPQG